MRSVLMAYVLLAAPFIVNSAAVPPIAGPGSTPGGSSLGPPGTNIGPPDSQGIPQNIQNGTQNDWKAHLDGLHNGTHYLVPMPLAQPSPVAAQNLPGNPSLQPSPSGNSGTQPSSSDNPVQRRAVEPAEEAPKTTDADSSGKSDTTDSSTDPSSSSAPIQVTPDAKTDPKTNPKPATTDNDSTCKRAADGSLDKRCATDDKSDSGDSGDGDDDENVQQAEASQSIENTGPAPASHAGESTASRNNDHNWMIEAQGPELQYPFKARQSLMDRIKSNAPDKQYTDMRNDYDVTFTPTDDVATQSEFTTHVQRLKELGVEFNPSGRHYTTKAKGIHGRVLYKTFYSNDGRVIIQQFSSNEKNGFRETDATKLLRNSDFIIQQHRETVTASGVAGGMSNLQAFGRPLVKAPSTIATGRAAYQFKKLNWNNEDVGRFNAQDAPGSEDYIVSEAFLRGNNGNANMWVLGDAQRSYGGKQILTVVTHPDDIEVDIIYLVGHPTPAAAPAAAGHA